MLLLLFLCRCCVAADGPLLPTYGWRGNWTGLFPDANPPVEWGRISTGVVAGMRFQAAKPGDGASAGGQPIRNGFVRDWLVLGPFAVEDSVTAFGKEQLAGEASARPDLGEKVGALVWKRLAIPKKPDYEVWGTTEFDWVNLASVFEYAPNLIGYAHTYLYCERPGKVTVVVDHCFGLKAWLNGQLVYTCAERAMGLGNYVGISRQKQELSNSHAPQFELDLVKGWNRLLVKMSSYNKDGWREMAFAPRFYDAAPVYDEKNIAWMTALPERSNAAPLIVGDRIFTPAEPDELLCLDKKTGKILWRAFNSLYDATPEAERAAFKDQIEPLAQQRGQATDLDTTMKLRHQMHELLVAADPKKFKLKWDGHFESHFGIIGFTTMPVSDGKFVYAFFGYGVVACYDLDGRRQWIRRLNAKQVGYTCSPALSGGKLLCVFGGLHALDAVTGNEAWSKPDVGCIASLIPMRVGATDAVTLQGDTVYRAADGALLWKNPDKGGGWGAPQFVDGKLYMLVLGVSDLRIADFAGCEGDEWKPKVSRIEIETDHRRPNGEWLDRSSPGSPLVWDGRCYAIDEYGVFYCADLATGKTLYKQDVGFDELHSYNHIGVAASPTLGGKTIYLMDNQGMCVVVETGSTFKQVAVNYLATTLPRVWPIPPQEVTANGPPVPDGNRLYVRGEKFLYCIGGK